MEIEYALTMKDLGAFNRPISEKKTKVKRMSRVLTGQTIWFLVLCFVVLWILLSPNNEPVKSFREFGVPFLFGLLVGAIGMVIVLALFKKIIVYSNERYREDERNRWLFEPQRARIDSEGLTVISAGVQMKIAWPVICQIDASEEWVRFWDTTRSGHVIPRRAFRDPQHVEEFVDLARRYQQRWDQPAPKSTAILAGLPPQSTAVSRPDAP